MSASIGVNHYVQLVEEELNAIDRQIETLHDRQHAIALHYDVVMITTRPEYPRAQDIADLRTAVDAIAGGAQAESHHGDRVRSADDCCVSWNERSGAIHAPGAHFVHFDPGAPYSKAQRGHKLWSLSDKEIGKIMSELRVAGASVRKHWRGGDGVSITFDLRE